METIEIRIEGMSCEGCSGSVTRRLQAVPGVASVEVMLKPGAARIDFDPEKTGVAALEAVIEEAGFDVVR
ncbi:copper chaperone [Formivibrio citricus]|uniref:Copper chaperone n=1 Tax=Formivibrio citricus TaxID=83765 RepID=A0A1I5B5T6_9NEIS|nr:heavy-metal-associated domain-containing protein [Formivibrio citricus]SFN69981.1 copper chaperone [Formivibrio citricus]